jgi:D-hydroxyproline dehydrogenase subunit gamma
MRIDLIPNSSQLVQRGPSIRILLNGSKVMAFAGETVATLLITEGHTGFTKEKSSTHAKGVYCGIGICFECLVQVNGENLRACQTYLKEDMRIETK